MATQSDSIPSASWWEASADRLGLQRFGDEWKGPCPACGGNDRFRLNEAGFYCRQCCPDGSDPEAMRRILEEAGWNPPERGNGSGGKPRPNRKAAPRYDATIYPELSGAESNRPEIPEGSKPSSGAQAGGNSEAGNSGGKQPLPTGRRRSWKYVSVEGGTVTVHRIDPTEDENRNGVEKSIWRKGKAEGPFLPLAGYKTGEDAPDYGIVICEGEATCDALREAGINATTGIGGVHLAKSTDWGPLRGMTIVLWPDNDNPGTEAMRELAVVLLSIGCKLKMIEDYSKLPPKADAADLEPKRITALVSAAEKIGDKSVDDIRTELEAEAGLNGGDPTAHQAALPLNGEGLACALELRNVNLRWNVRRCRTERQDGATWRAVDDRWESDLRGSLEREFKGYRPLSERKTLSPFSFGRDRWRDLVNAHLASREVDCFREWLESLPVWDGHERLLGLIEHCFDVTGNHDPLLHGWAGRFIFLGAVARTFRPGLKLDEIPVLIGAQGTGKSTLSAWTFPEEFRETWFSDGLSFADRTKEQAEALEGRVIVEISEMHGSSRSEIERIKSFLSRQNDGAVRRAYARNPESSPRRCVMIGTSNSRACLPSDPSGNRRFVAVSVGNKIGTANIMQFMDANRVQLWAEALALHRRGVHARLSESLKNAQAETNSEYRARDDLLEDRLDSFIDEREITERFSTEELMEAASGSDVNAGDLTYAERWRLQQAINAHMERRGLQACRFRTGNTKKRGFQRRGGPDLTY